MLSSSVKWLRRSRIRSAALPLEQPEPLAPAATSTGARLPQLLVAALLLLVLLAGAAPSLGGALTPLLFQLHSDPAAAAAATAAAAGAAALSSAAAGPAALSSAAAPSAALAAAGAAGAAAAAAATAGTWPPPPLAWPPHRASPYSSHECTAGVQAFTRGYATQTTHTARFPLSEDPFVRVCLLRDVCFVQGELMYYVDPALSVVPPHLQPSALSPHLVYLGYQKSHFGRVDGIGERYEVSFAPTYIAGPRPPALRYAPGAATIHALGVFSFPNNWGHLMVDTLLPALSALEVFGYNHSDLQLLNLVTCATSHAATSPAAFSAQPGVTLGDMCRENLARWLAPAFAHPLMGPADADNTCFSRLLVGHEPPFSLDALYLHRASAARTLRALLLRSYGLAHLQAPGAGLPAAAAAAHSIVVLVKAPQANTAYLPALCVQVQGWAGRLRQGGGGAIPVRCEHPALMPAAAQLALYASGTVFVGENGSTGYAALLLGPGASFVAVLGLPEEVAKESATLLHLPDINFFYSSFKDMEESGAETLLLAAERAGVRLGLPPVTLAPK